MFLLKTCRSSLSRGVLIKRCFENMQQIYKRTTMPNCDFNFNKVAKQTTSEHRYKEDMYLGTYEISTMELSLVGIFSNPWKVSKYGVFSGPYFPVFSPNTGKYRPEKTPYLDTFHTVFIIYC